MNRRSGITLIALVITIIILLILAGITISTLTGENGIITRAKEARESAKKAQYFEEINLEILEEISERFEIKKPELLIQSLKQRIKNKEWTDDEHVIICKEIDGEFEPEAQGPTIDSNILLIETKDKYEIIVEVNNSLLQAKIREEYFEKAGKRIIVTLDPNEAEGEKVEKEVRAGFSIILEKPEYTRSGYKFVGWCDKQNGEGTKYLAGSKYKVEKDVTLYAIWEQETVILTLKANNGTEEQEEKQVTPNEKVTLPENQFEREGYNFTKWNTKEDGTGTAYESGVEVTLTQNVILYAQWEEIKYSLTYNANEGERNIPATAEYKEGENVKVNFDIIPIKKGYNFVGWAEDSSAEDATFKKDGKTSLTFGKRDVILYAIWVDNEKPAEFSISTSNITYNSITISGSTTDEGSGIKNYTYIAEKSNGEIVKKIENQGIEYTITGLIDGTDYTVYIIAYDNAGNDRRSEIKQITMLKETTDSLISIDEAYNWSVTINGVSKGANIKDSSKLTPWVREALFNGNLNEGGYHGIGSSPPPSYIKFTAHKNIRIYAYGHYLSDSGGALGKNAVFEKLSGESYVSYKTVPTDTTGNKYELITLEAGQYKLSPAAKYIGFDEWVVERVY